MTLLTKIGTASLLALATATPLAAQQYRPTPEYQRQQDTYDGQRQQYEASRDQYNNSREDYREARRDYDGRLTEWERARAAYDARFGVGSYARYYARPAWDEGYWTTNDRNGNDRNGAYNPGRNESRADYREARRDYDRRMNDWEQARTRYDRRYGNGSYERRYVRPTWNDSYWSSADRYSTDASTNTVRCNNNSAVAGGVIGAIAGAVLGSNVAARNARTEGTVLGGVLGAAVGAGVGNANDKYKCDARGPYFSHDETRPYREGRNRYASNFDRSYYDRNRCRLAAAPVDRYGEDVRYVRVCPDETGRYRITG